MEKFDRRLAPASTTDTFVVEGGRKTHIIDLVAGKTLCGTIERLGFFFNIGDDIKNVDEWLKTDCNEVCRHCARLARY
jgi:hypothetical protein